MPGRDHLSAISPKTWGSSGWSLLHRMSFCFTKADDATRFYKTLEFILPCQKCRNNIEDHYKSLPFPRRASEFPRYVWQLHTRVSESIVKGHDDTRPHPYQHPSFKEVRDMYLNSCHETKTCEATFLLALAETHPGAAKITDAYLEAMHTFIQMYVTNSNIGEEVHLHTLMSRSAFRTWVQKITKSRKHYSQ
jgi:hypothetical protein